MDVASALASRRIGSVLVTAGVILVSATWLLLLTLASGSPVMAGLGTLAVCALLGLIGAGAYFSYFTGLRFGPISVVSGMARGIDAAAHRTALEEGGNTVAVLGTGVDVPYPVGHRLLHRAIAEHGIVVSENPPGARAGPGSFPRRNRIIAALAPVTIVIEAGFRSGALNTAAQALELGRVVAAVPGPIDSDQSRGSNQLLRDGAVLIAAPEDALALLGVSAPPVVPLRPLLPESEQKIWDAIAGGFVDTDALPAATDLTIAECLAAITSLEIMGLVECSLAGEIRRR
jgi:DNA processing protein